MELGSSIILLILGLITLGLGVYLGVLVSRLKSQANKRRQSEDQLRELAKERQSHLIESIITISRAAVQDQCELSEACIRLKKLLENYPTIAEKSEFEIISRMYVELKDFDYLEARKKLSKQEKFNQDKRRFMVEDKFRDPMLKSMALLITTFEGMREERI